MRNMESQLRGLRILKRYEKYNSQKTFEADIVNGVFVSKESIDITSFSLDVEARLEVRLEDGK